VLRFHRLHGPALRTVEQAIERDDTFRAQVAASVAEVDVGRPSWLWLARPDGWAAELDGLVDEVRAAEDEVAARHDVDALRSEVARLEAALAAATERAAAAEAERDRSAERLLDEQRARVAAEAAQARLEADAAQLADERTVAMRRMKELERSDAEARGDRNRERARRRELEAALARSESDGSGNGAVDLPGAELPGVPDLAVLEAAVAEASDAAATVGRALAEARRVLAEPPIADPDGPGDGPAQARAPRRRPARLPPPMVDDSPEAVAHLLRLPEALLLVDGYNISMAAWPGVPITDQRLRLVDALRELHARTRVEVVTVFDGSRAGRRPPGVAGREVRVLFTGADQIADDRIVELVEATPADRPVLVATSDRELQERVRRGGANVIRTKLFLGALGR